MAPKSKPKPKPTKNPDHDFPTYTFPTASSFNTFLSTHHKTLPGIYLHLAKKSSGIPSISAPEAVETALCYGWIDGRANTVDDNYWSVRYTPRRAKSIWSQKNVETVGRLIEEGRMSEMGLKAVEDAKRDGRWEAAYGGMKNIVVPRDFEEVVMGDERARGVWEGMGRAERYPILLRLQIGRAGSREGRIRRVVEGLRRRGDGGDKEDVVMKPKAKKGVRRRKEVVRLAVEGEKDVRVPRREGLRKRV